MLMGFAPRQGYLIRKINLGEGQFYLWHHVIRLSNTHAEACFNLNKTQF